MCSYTRLGQMIFKLSPIFQEGRYPVNPQTKSRNLPRLRRRDWANLKWSLFMTMKRDRTGLCDLGIFHFIKNVKHSDNCVTKIKSDSEDYRYLDGAQ